MGSVESSKLLWIPGHFYFSWEHIPFIYDSLTKEVGSDFQICPRLEKIHQSCYCLVFAPPTVAFLNHWSLSILSCFLSILKTWHMSSWCLLSSNVTIPSSFSFFSQVLLPRRVVGNLLFKRNYVTLLPLLLKETSYFWSVTHFTFITCVWFLFILFQHIPFNPRIQCSFLLKNIPLLSSF